MTEPDFEEWANIQFSKLSHIDRYRIANYLAQSFEQGYYLGLNQGWAIEQDKDSSAIKETLNNLRKEFPNGFHNPED